MNRIYLFSVLNSIVVVAIAGVVATACSVIGDDRIYDYCPVEMSLVVRDDEGNDLLDPENVNNLIDEVVVEYAGKRYTTNMGGNKALPATWFGLMLMNNALTDTVMNFPYNPYVAVDGYYLVFGQWDGGDNHDFSFDLIIDGQINRMTYSRKVKRLDVKEKWTLNGKSVTMPVRITK